MLKDDFYFITSNEKVATTIQASTQLNPNHPIFAGHFPGEPIVPGVCLIQMCREVLEDALKTGFLLQKIPNIKFLAPVNPLKHEILHFQFDLTLFGESQKSKILITLPDGTIVLKGAMLYKKK